MYQNRLILNHKQSCYMVLHCNEEIDVYININNNSINLVNYEFPIIVKLYKLNTRLPTNLYITILEYLVMTHLSYSNVLWVSTYTIFIQKIPLYRILLLDQYSMIIFN